VIFNAETKVFFYYCLFVNFFRKQAQQWHPDNFQNDEESRKKAEKKFIDIAAAKEVLTDPGIYRTYSTCPLLFIKSN
jgi:DnaJ domain